jgi:hypothetical protein
VSLKIFLSVHFVVPTPQEVHAVVKSLAETEITNNSIVWLCTEDEVPINMEQLAVAPIRVDEFELQDHHQVIVATPKAFSRLPLSRGNKSHPSPLLVLVCILFFML